MKEGWEYKRLEEICTPINGLWKGKKEPFVNVGVIRNANFKKDFTLDFSNIEYLDVEAKKFASRKLEPGDLIVERSGGSEKQPVGRAVLFNQSEGDYSFSNFTSVIRINDRKQVSPIFLFKYLLYFYLKGETRPMQNAAIGLHNLDFKRYLSIEVPVPPLSEQQRIVSYLDAAFAKINAVAKNAEDSLNEAKALFQSALTKMMEPKEGWEEKTLSMLGESKVGPFGSLLHKKDYIEGGIPIINPMHIVKGKISPNHKFTVSIEKLNKDLSSYLMHTNDIVIGRRGEMGRCAIVKPSQNGFVCGTGSIFFRPKTSIVNPRFLLTALLSSKSKKEMEALAGGATMLNLSSKSLSNLSIDIPSLQEQCAIVSTLDSLKSKVDQLQSNLSLTLTECTALKQAILRQTFE